MNVYFLDDDYSTNRYHEITLEEKALEYDCKISFHDHPQELLNAFDSGDLSIPDLIFLDINMPMLDGWEFLDIFMKNFPDAPTKFIVLTTSNNPLITEKAELYDLIVDVTTKPLKPEYIDQLMNKVQA